MSRGEVPWFGHAEPDDYATRPSVYVVIRDSGRRVAAVRAPVGLFLPGGGIEEGEAPREAAIREVAEETGLQVLLSEEIGTADECLRIEGRRPPYMVKRSTFYSGSVIGLEGRSELDHHLVWLSSQEARVDLTYHSHRWAVARTLA